MPKARALSGDVGASSPPPKKFIFGGSETLFSGLASNKCEKAGVLSAHNIISELGVVNFIHTVYPNTSTLH